MAISALPMRYWFILPAILLAPLGISLYLGFTGTARAHWLEPESHSLIEGFCALMSLVVFYMLHQEHVASGNPRLRWMSYGFLSMGIFDLFHTLSPPGANVFIWFHSVSALSGALFLTAALLGPQHHPEPHHGLARAARQAAVRVGASMIAIGILSYALQAWVPAMTAQDSFSPVAKGINLLATGLFVATGIALFRDFRHSQESLLLILAAGIFLLAESAALFPVSRLWDMSWWLWHGIKVVIFVAILLGLAYEFSQSFVELSASRRDLLQALKAVEQRNRALAVQAAILEDISRSLDVSSVLNSIIRAVKELMGFSDCCIVVDDRSGRPARLINSEGLVTDLAAEREDLSTEKGNDEGATCTDHDGHHVCPSVCAWARAQEHQSCCVPLRAKGRVLGRFCVGTENGRALDAEAMARLSSFASQAAIALENAELHEELLKRHEDLTRLHAVLIDATSSLDLGTVLLRTAEHLAKAMDIPRVLVYMLEEDRGVARVHAEYDALDHRPAAGGECVLAEHPFLAKAMQTLGPVWANHAVEPAIEHLAGTVLARELGGRASQGTPRVHPERGPSRPGHRRPGSRRGVERPVVRAGTRSWGLWCCSGRNAPRPSTRTLSRRCRSSPSRPPLR